MSIFLDLQARDADESDSDAGSQHADGLLEGHFIDEGDSTNEAESSSNLYRLARADEEDRNNQSWQGLLNRAHAHAAKSKARSRDSDEEDYASHVTDSDDEAAAEELIGWRLQAFPFLREDLRNNLPEDVFKRIDLSPSHTDWPWAKVRGHQKKWKTYADDTGFLTTIEGYDEIYLALIPRIASRRCVEISSKPPQELVTRSSLRKVAKANSNGTFIWKGRMFSPEGFLLVDLKKIKIVPYLEPLPTIAELAIFRGTSLLPDIIADRTERQIEVTRLKYGDRVKVVSGPYTNLIGEVREMSGNRVGVYLPSQDVLEDMSMDTVRAAFCIGDEVRVIEGEQKGLVGWVIGFLEAKLCIVDKKASKETTVATSNVEFYSHDRIIGLQPRLQHAAEGKNLGEKNPNDVYIQKRVMIIGIHELKRYKGYIKSTTLDGFAYVQLDTRLQQCVKVSLHDLACLTYLDNCERTLTTLEPVEDTMPQFQSAEESSCLAPTPAWDPSESQTYESSAWDPSSRTPLPCQASSSTAPAFLPETITPPLSVRSLSSNQCHPLPPPTQTPPPPPLPRIPTPPPRTPPPPFESLGWPVQWLAVPHLQGIRLKLKVNDPSVQSPYVEFVELEHNLVKVRDKMSIGYFSFESISPLFPEREGDLVIPKEGPMRGIYLRILRIVDNICTARKLGVNKPTKNNPDVQFAIHDLLQVFPPLRLRRQ